MSRRIIGIGETVLDVIFRDNKPQDAIPGGSTFNALVSLGRTVKKNHPEVPICMVTETGDDHIGDMIVSFMKDNGIDDSLVTRHIGGQSHISMAFLDANNDAQYEFYKDHANAGLSEELINDISFSRDDIVLFGSFFAINPAIRSTVRDLLTKAHEAGALLYYDINFRKSHIKDLPLVLDNIIENCRLADYVRGSSEDFCYLFGTADGQTIYNEHISHLCSNFILTKGAEPIEIYTPGGRSIFETDPIETVSTIGAGDNFNAGIIYSFVDYNIYRGTAPDDALWRSIVAIATSFSSAVCRSIDNYVDESFSI